MLYPFGRAWPKLLRCSCSLHAFPPAGKVRTQSRVPGLGTKQETENPNSSKTRKLRTWPGRPAPPVPGKFLGWASTGFPVGPANPGPATHARIKAALGMNAEVVLPFAWPEQKTASQPRASPWYLFSCKRARRMGTPMPKAPQNSGRMWTKSPMTKRGGAGSAGLTSSRSMHNISSLCNTSSWLGGAVLVVSVSRAVVSALRCWVVYTWRPPAILFWMAFWRRSCRFCSAVHTMP